METNESMPEPVESPGESSQTGQTPSLYDAMSWKTVVFVVVMLLAGAVAAHSLLATGRGNSTPTAGGGSSVSPGWPQVTGTGDAGCPIGKRCCPPGKCLESPQCAADPQCKKPGPNSPDTTALGCCPASAVPKQ